MHALSIANIGSRDIWRIIDTALTPRARYGFDLGLYSSSHILSLQKLLESNAPHACTVVMRIARFDVRAPLRCRHLTRSDQPQQMQVVAPRSANIPRAQHPNRR